MSAAKSKVEHIIAQNNVVVFSKSYCPYSSATKSLLNELGIPYYALELDEIDDGAAIQDVLAALTHQRTVPNIFIAQKHIGGNSDIQARKSELSALVSAGAAAKASKA
ncbi:glutaredoxin 3 [Blastomyces dermatitidis ATCC 18188]|uniref:Glutaredoxin 3 n=1 Tax=Ajellomyces dermatitidis (strain ATCC 18188 / CBS 674.68) TaxID=653446 RepID=F2TAA4_AJEDA|nr:glutaredoxin 3 [Blastomyces dermatitidis ATCC 18188]